MTPIVFPTIRVLLVEDDVFLRGTMRRMLRSLGCSDVREAGDGTEGLRALDEGDPLDLVLCDVQMQPMDGLAFLKQLRASTDRRNAALPVLMLTGVADTVTVRDTSTLGVSGYLLKPVSTKTLSQRISGIFGSRPA